MADEIKIKEKEIVVPGEILAEGLGFVPGRGTYRKDKEVIAQQLGVASVEGKVLKVNQLSGVYTPRLDDRVIGQVIDVLMTGWRISLNGPYTAVLSLKEATSRFVPKGTDLTQFLKVGDYVVVKIINVTSQRLVDVMMRAPGLMKLEGGRVITVNAFKVPRIIGKDGSMITMLKEATNCDIVIGQNGFVWINGEPKNEVLAVNTIRKIEESSHISGLTDTIKAELEKATGKKLAAKQTPAVRSDENALQ
jgi:exosome complex component RRP4